MNDVWEEVESALQHEAFRRSKGRAYEYPLWILQTYKSYWSDWFRRSDEFSVWEMRDLYFSGVNMGLHIRLLMRDKKKRKYRVIAEHEPKPGSGHTNRSDIGDRSSDTEEAPIEC